MFDSGDLDSLWVIANNSHLCVAWTALVVQFEYFCIATFPHGSVFIPVYVELYAGVISKDSVEAGNAKKIYILGRKMDMVCLYVTAQKCPGWVVAMVMISCPFDLAGN